MEALLKVVIAADNLAEAVERAEPTEQFKAKLKKYLEDGKKAGEHLRPGPFADSVEDFISKEFRSRGMSKPQGEERNAIIRLVADYLDLSQHELADVVGTSAATVNRVLNDDETGGAEQGHGGARR